MHWSDVIADNCLQDLPYKIELNKYGKIEMSPASNRHGFYQNKVARLLEKARPDGIVIIECAIETEDGVKVADVVWGSEIFYQQHSIDETPFTIAPEICVEIISPANSQAEMNKKKQLYFNQGAKEVWLVSLEGNIQLFDHKSIITISQFSIPIKKL